MLHMWGSVEIKNAERLAMALIISCIGSQERRECRPHLLNPLKEDFETSQNTLLCWKVALAVGAEL